VDGIYVRGGEISHVHHINLNHTLVVALVGR
jgi:hypothetical protein